MQLVRFVVANDVRDRFAGPQACTGILGSDRLGVKDAELLGRGRFAGPAALLGQTVIGQ